MRSLGGVILLVDRTMALSVGMAAGAAIAFSFESAPVAPTADRHHSGCRTGRATPGGDQPEGGRAAAGSGPHPPRP